MGRVDAHSGVALCTIKLAVRSAMTQVGWFAGHCRAELTGSHSAPSGGPTSDPRPAAGQVFVRVAPDRHRQASLIASGGLSLR